MAATYRTVLTLSNPRKTGRIALTRRRKLDMLRDLQLMWTGPLALWNVQTNLSLSDAMAESTTLELPLTLDINEAVKQGPSNVFRAGAERLAQL